MTNSIEEIVKKIDALGIWKILVAYNWAIKPMGTVFPYFFMVDARCDPEDKVSFHLLEGWQTMHYCVSLNVDKNFGYVQSCKELPQYEIRLRKTGEVQVARYDTGYWPYALSATQTELLLKMLWEAYGVIMRIEANNRLPMQYAEQTAMFSRAEVSSGVWEDKPLVIPKPSQYVEHVTLPKSDIALAKQHAVEPTLKWAVNFGITQNRQVRIGREKAIYRLLVVNMDTKEVVEDRQLTISDEGGVKNLWENVPYFVLQLIIKHQVTPGELHIASGRMFRLLRVLGIELPFKLLMHDRLPIIER